MATRCIFTPFAAEFPATNFPQLLLSNRRPVLAFDGATDEACFFTGLAPQGLTGAITVVITYAAASATTGTCRFEALLEAITDGDATDTDAATSFDATNSNGAAVPATAGYIDQISITMTNADSLTAGDYFRLQLNRDANGTTGTDDVATDVYVLAVELRDAA